jgi:hypothetical protein
MADVPSLHIGTAGASARRKAEHFRQEREQLRSTRRGLGRLLATSFPSEKEKRLQEEERDYATGAKGEQILARSLARRCPAVPMLHDRRAPMRMGNIDHIAIAPTGVYVIDCKRYKGKIRVAKPLFGRASLKIDRRNHTRLLEGLGRHVADVKAAVVGLADDVPVHGCLCFVAPAGLLSDIGLPILRTLKIGGYALYYPRRLAKRLNTRRAPLTPEQANLLARQAAAAGAVRLT